MKTELDLVRDYMVDPDGSEPGRRHAPETGDAYSQAKQFEQAALIWVILPIVCEDSLTYADCSSSAQACFSSVRERGMGGSDEHRVEREEAARHCRAVFGHCVRPVRGLDTRFKGRSDRARMDTAQPGYESVRSRWRIHGLRPSHRTDGPFRR